MAPSDPPFQPHPAETPAGDTNLACREADSAGRCPELGKDCWILSGPTAAGKTALAVEMAARIDAEIVSVDSMAVYRGLDIGTAKPSAGERSRVHHHLLDLVGPDEPYNVARWLEDAGRAVAEIRGRGRQILFVGGTPLYLRALRDGLAVVPAEDPQLRQALLAEVMTGGSLPLHRRLAGIDPAAAARIHPNDVRRIVRALEVAQISGRPLSAAFAPQPHPVFATQMMVLDLPRDTLRRRIDLRVEQMFDRGLLDEVRQAAAQPGGIGPTAGQAAGYAEALAVLAGEISPAEAIRRTQQRTRQLAKRQLTWLRSFSGAVWIAA